MKLRVILYKLWYLFLSLFATTEKQKQELKAEVLAEMIAPLFKPGKVKFQTGNIFKTVTNKQRRHGC
jgi:hypothetical protein